MQDLAGDVRRGFQEQVAVDHVADLAGAAERGKPAALAVEYAALGIRVNAVSPGIIQAPLHLAGGLDGLGGRLPPLGRAGQVSDVVDGVLFLESSPYITGEVLHIDGGQIAGHCAPPG